MKVFFGGAIQGFKESGIRSSFNNELMDCIKQSGFDIITEHTKGKNYEERAKLLDKAIGPLPPKGLKRTVYVRDKMIEAIEGDIIAAIFEVSNPSLGTGIEIAHAYLRPRLGLKKIPVLALYEKDYWPNKLSSMIRGISKDRISQFTLKEYSNVNDAKKMIKEFLFSI